MSKNEPVKPGQRTRVSGQYLEVGPRGGRTSNEITSVQGKPIPPTTKPGNSYILVDRTK